MVCDHVTTTLFSNPAVNCNHKAELLELLVLSPQKKKKKVNKNQSSNNF